MKFLLFLFMLLCADVKAQNPGPILSAMGSGGTAVSGIWSLQQNPAGIARLRRAHLTMAYEQRFLDEELSTQTALFAAPFSQGVIGASFDSYGFSEYKEIQTGLFYAKGFGDSFTMAVGARFHQLNIKNYGSAKAYTVELGFQLKLTDNLTIASHLSNPNRSRYTIETDPGLPVKLSFGASYIISDRILMSLDVRKVLTDPLDGMAGIQYNLVDWFSLRGGVSANPFKQYTGFGINHKRIHVDVAVTSHQNLGYTPQIALGYEF
ncbi:PorV/PorQ family protein [Daejeonella lutea]|uniref:Outer membrane protein beta-barrel domain-containing protein n=1 Tax=Daejeonella lutea TaxID=572036 RepID=A0A1T5B4I2_9SPHI|nr:hypothetical protein [Daejeonella lutea]SKB42171.1 hypothetical protein SAMN05661099_1286 [Daejeonella lutea]